MADVFTIEKRSEIMSRIRSKNTKAELIAFKYLRKEGVYFQKHYSRAAGKPDIALPRKKKAVFIDGDFWHGRSFDDVRRRRGDNDYWTGKIARNMERDLEQRQELAEKGWRIMSVWESDIARKRTCAGVLEEIKSFLTSEE